MNNLFSSSQHIVAESWWILGLRCAILICWICSCRKKLFLGNARKPLPLVMILDGELALIYGFVAVT
jgi:hypothetical protein